jgi:zinc protease
MEERRMRTDDEPHALLNEKLFAAIYQEHPYQHPIIGWMNDLLAMQGADARDWYRTWYAPNNAVLVIAGDVVAADVFKLAQKYYGPIPAGKLPARKHFQEPAQVGIKRLVVKAPAELPLLVMAYRAPTLLNAENDNLPYALEILAGVLDGNESARLNKSLVREQQIASSIGTGYESTSRGPSLFMLEGTPSAGKTVADLEAAFRQQIDKIIRDGVSEEELKRVRAQVLASEIYKRDSVFYQAMQIGQMESIGLGYQALPLMLKKLQAVTAAQVQAAAKAVFNDDGLTIAVLDPQPLSGQPSPAKTGAAHAH